MEHIYTQPQFGENWFTYSNFYSEMVERFPSGSHFVEIGSWKGKSSVYMAVEIINSGKDIKFDCVDPWMDAQPEGVYYETYPNLYETFLSNIEPVKTHINPVRKFSADAVKNYKRNSLDFVFIDGNHEHPFIDEDIKLWYPKVKSGGIIAGHDYPHPPVFEAVNAKFKEVESREECWIYVKP